MVFLARLAIEVLEEDVRDGERRWELEAESQVGLPVALINFDCVVHVIDYHGVVGDILDHA